MFTKIFHLALRKSRRLNQSNDYRRKGRVMFITMIGVNNDGTLMESPSFSDPFSF